MDQNRKNRRGILVASFMDGYTPEQVQEEVQYIVDHLTLTNNMIFLLQQKNNLEQKILTYNIETTEQRRYNPRVFTRRINRKKQTNTLYTINALNAALSIQYEGSSGSHLKLDWEKYNDCVMLTTGKKLEVHPLEVLKIFKIEDEPEEN